ncbi:MAG: hypothetical protein GY814_03225, partial [Gammaproteobacteria bacterium]|nr:hypothetical protein [Gammaproteobacteria bacterium]
MLNQYLKKLILTLFLLALNSVSLASLVTGYVYTREVVTDASGNVIWGEYDTQTGGYIKDIGSAIGDLDPKYWRVMSGDEYRSIVAQKNALHSEQPEPLLLSRDQLSAGLLLADG